MNKKIISLLSAASLLTCAMAAPLSASAEDKPCLALGSSIASENTLVSINASLDTPVKAAAYSMILQFDPEKLEFVSAKSGVDDGTFYFKSKSDDCVRLVWSSSKDTELEGNIASIVFKTRSETLGSSVPVEISYCVFGSDDMTEIPLETQNGNISVVSSLVPGDANCNDVINLSDAVTIDRFCVEHSSFTVSQSGLLNCDMNRNGVIDKNDCDAVMQLASSNK